MWAQPRNGKGWRAADSVQSLKEEPTVIERERMTSAGAESVAAARLEITPCHAPATATRNETREEILRAESSA